ncbi:hypothetical protein [Streptomyces lycii]|uniref:Uncharacterized protein n=1 Tax=Streptomyces lycii TaxID=2654337 RepID=A0ABQ7FDV7_9ACTN|nr:hypothetical protein [Streptomyces lycii]KAF4407052.1 hypothetical protein GCU69_21700 [Streptomyces lycii]
MLAELTGALRGGDARPLREWLASRGVDTGSLRGLPRWNADPPQDGVPSVRRPPGRADRVVEEVAGQLEKVTGEPGGVALLLLHLLDEVEEAFELSYHFGLLWDTLRGARICVRDRLDALPAAEAAAARAVLPLLSALDEEILAENAVTSGLLTAQAEASERAAGHCRETAAAARSLPAGHEPLAEYLTHAAARGEVYNHAISGVARAVTAHLENGAPLDAALAALTAAEQHPRLDDRKRVSVLRAHRFSLTALRRDADADWLRVDHGTLSLLYPFALRGATPEDVVELVAGTAADWRLADAVPVQVHASLELDDMWDGSDSLGRRYDGARAELPDVVVRDLGGTELSRFGAEIIFSRLGNHFVRFHTELLDVTPADLYALLFRAAPEHGSGAVTFDPGPGPAAGGAGAAGPGRPRLSDLALDLARDAAAEVRAATGGTNGVQAVCRPGMFQAVVAVHEASVARGPARNAAPRREVRTIEEFAAAAGAQVLTNPVTHLVGSIAEWSRYATRGASSSTVVGMTGDWTVSTCNTTLLVGLGAAGFTMSGRRMTAEFAASLDGLFAGWSDELAGHYRRTRDFQRRAEEAGADPAAADPAALLELARELDAEKIRLHDFSVEARSAMALIRSPSLVSSPVEAQILERLLEESGYSARVRELVRTMDEVAHEQLGPVIEKIAAQRAGQEDRADARAERRQRAKLDSLLAVIAAVGISGLGQILQSGYAVEATGSALIVTAIVLLAGFVGGWFYLAARRGT